MNISTVPFQSHENVPLVLFPIATDMTKWDCSSPVLPQSSHHTGVTNTYYQVQVLVSHLFVSVYKDYQGNDVNTNGVTESHLYKFQFVV